MVAIDLVVFFQGIPSPDIAPDNKGGYSLISLSCNLNICNIYYCIDDGEYSLYVEPFFVDNMSTVTAYSTVGKGDWVIFKSSTASKRILEAISDNPIKYTATLGPGQKVELEIELPAENDLDDSSAIGFRQRPYNV